MRGWFYFVTACAICLAARGSVEPVRWFDGTWDVSGAPKGKLLTGNGGWWGRCVYTGVSYTYGEAPSSPRDQLRADASVFGRRLLDGDRPSGWHRPVGMTKNRPISVTFDFKRPCTFAEVDLVSSKSPQARAEVHVSSDGLSWTPFATAVCAGTLTRIRPHRRGNGRYLRVTFRSATSASTYLDEVLVWGDGEVSAAFPEDIRPIPRGDALRMTDRRDCGIFWRPLKDPAEGFLQQFGQPPFSYEEDTAAGSEIVLARNETEIRYFAVVNGSAATVRVPLSAPDFGAGVRAELLIGGLVRTQPPKYRLTEKQRFDLLLTGEEPEAAFDPDSLMILPFFPARFIPPGNFARKYLANPGQVAGFPGAVEIAPGEGAVVMFRVTTDGAAPGRRFGSLAAGAARYGTSVRIVDATLPDAAPWIFAWSPFTEQFPFESRTRIANDVRSVRDLGVTTVSGLPEKGTKAEALSKDRGNAVVYYRVNGVGKRVRDKIYKAKKETVFDETDRRAVRARTEELRKQAAACGVSPDRLMLEICDEPGAHNAALFGDVCRYLRAIAPEMSIYMNPCFWMKTRFMSIDGVIAALGGYYASAVDVSVPYRSLVEEAGGRAVLWSTPRRVNAQYAHPAHRAGRSIAWSSFRYGLDGFGYWCYFRDTGGNPWDIRTWRVFSYEVNLVLPLENGVASTPVYEEMREAKEDWLLLSLLRQSGKKEVLDGLLDEFARSFDRPRMETAKPYACDFTALRRRALDAFRMPDAE